MKKTLVLALALASTLTACGGDDGKDQVGQGSTPKCSTAPTTKDLSTKPAPSVPEGAVAPTTTASVDVVVGKGAEAKEGSNVEVKYVGVLFDDCTEFDSSWRSGPDNTLPFTIGGGVIPGFSKGVTGMHVGGRRQVVIPASEGYGSEGQGPIPGGAALIFMIDLVSVS
jgi:peptidylprolyl isomerase